MTLHNRLRLSSCTLAKKSALLKPAAEAVRLQFGTQAVFAAATAVGAIVVAATVAFAVATVAGAADDAAKKTARPASEGSAPVAAAGERALFPADLYVSPRGNDAHSGTLPEPNAQGTDGPLATLSAAQQAVRRLKQRRAAAGESPRPIVVAVRGGTYRLSEPIVFSSEDSGTADAPVTYRAFPNESPIFTSNAPIGPWRAGDDGLWTAEVPEVAQGKWYFRTLFVNGRRAVPARTPNEGWYASGGSIDKLNRATARNDANTRKGFRFVGDEIRPWRNLDDAVLVYHHCWTTSRHRITGIDPQEKIVRLSNPPNWPFGWWKEERYYVEYVAEALDAPGEWYLDRGAGRLSYKPLPGESIERIAAEAPKCEELLRLEGDAAAGKWVEHIRFEGLRFRGTDWTMPRDAPVDRQSAAFLATATVRCRGARHCRFFDCEIAQTGGYGLWFERGVKHCSAEQCHLFDLGAGGVRIGENSLPKNPEEQTSHNTIENCFIHDGGRVFHAGVGALIQKSSYNTLKHCEICDFFYSGVSVGWTWGYAESEAHHNTVDQNHIHHLGYGVLSDMGGIYCLGKAPGTRLAGNVIHDVLAHTYGGWGLYTDEGSSGIVMENNIVYRCKDASFHQHYGRENIVRNNVLAFAATFGQIRRSREEEHLSFTIERNIILYGDAPLLGGNWKNGQYKFEKNLYWNTAGKLVVFPGNLALEQWQAQGQDAGSIIADPLFENAAAGDFRLKPDSPALKLGFRPIDTSHVGLCGPADWRALPTKVERPPLKMPGEP